MRITALEVTWLKSPLGRPFTAFYGRYSESEHVLVKLHTDTGVTGIAEAPGYDVAEAMAAVIQRRLGPAIIGLDPRQPDVLHRRLDEAVPTHNSSYRSSKFALDQAAYDAAGKALGLPVAALLAGSYRAAVPVACMVGIEEPEAVGEEALRLLGEGYRQIKLKAGADFERDLRTVRTVREAWGERMRIRLDINTGYGSAARAIPLCSRLEAAGVDIFEQPVAA